MRNSVIRRSSLALLFGSLVFQSAPAQAVPLSESASESPAVESRLPDSRAARAAIRRLLVLGTRAESRQGGKIALARQQAETSGAKTTRAWLDWLPDFSIAVRRQIEQETETELSAPRWRFDFEGQVALSVPKVRAIGVARAARRKSQAELEQTEHATREETLEASFDLYFMERRAALLDDQIGAFESLASTLPQSASEAPTDDRVLLEGYLGELRGTLADVEFRRREAAQRLGATLEVPLGETGLDPRLDLPALLASIRAEFDGSSARVARVHQADVQLEKQRLRWTESQSWYVPELRSTTLAMLPRGSTAEPSSASVHLTSLTTEVALGLRLRPGVPALQAAQRSAMNESRFDEEDSRWLRARTEDQARARLGELSRAWLDDHAVRVAELEFNDAVTRFARGERRVADLAVASRTLVATQFQREGLLEDATVAQLTIAANDRTDLAPLGAIRRQEWEPDEVDRGLHRSLDRAPAIQGARAAAEQATRRARSQRFLLSTAVEAGFLLPLYESNELGSFARPELSLSGSGSLATAVREASVLGRWSLDLRPTDAAQRAFETEARLRQAQVDLERKNLQWHELEARLELAHARSQLELSTHAAQLALEAWREEQAWFAQGAASEREVRIAELAHHSARIEQSKAEARMRSAESVMASHLDLARGSRVAVHESPEALETSARQHFIPDNQLFGFESAQRRHEAELEVELAHAQTRALAKPTRGTTLTTQVVQGLRGGAFSFTLALSVALDSARDAAQITRAAESEGRARGHLLSFEQALEEERAQARRRFEEASVLLRTEATIQQQLSTLAEAVRREQAAAPDVHPAVKQRQLRALQVANLESEKRRLAAEEQRRSAKIRSLALGDSIAPATSSSASTSIEAAELAAIQRSPDVAVADAVAAEARNHRPVPVASAFHPVGPFAIGSYSANRVVGPSTTKVWRGDLGVGLSLGLDEAISFLASQRLSKGADLEQRAARQRAALRAVQQFGSTWTARELERLSREEENEARRRLEGSVQPRFELGQVTAATLLEAQQRHAFSLLRHSSDEALLRTQHAALRALGAPLTDEALDEYQRRAARLSAGHSATQPIATPTEADPAQLAAQERSSAASAETAASALRFVSPISAIVESRPARFETTTGTEDDRRSSAGHELLWVFSLIVPFKPKEFGTLAVDAARARESHEELSAAAREARLRWLDLQTRLTGLHEERARAIARRVAAERALAELDRRLRAAQDHASIDEVAAARAALFDARRAEVVVNGAIFRAAMLIEAAKENR